MGKWREREPQFLRQRYNHLAPFYPLFEWLFWLPRGIRAKAVSRLALKSGDRVLEVGCGTGRNLPLLVQGVGREGHVYGLDLSESMLARATALSERHKWRNVTLQHRDAIYCTLPESVNGVLFSLSYCTMAHRREILRRSWEQLRSHGRVVILEAKPASGVFGRLLTPIGAWLSSITVLGNPEIRPWEDLRELAGQAEMEEFQLGTYFIAHATKPGHP